MLKLIDILNEAKKVKETFEDFAKKRGEGAAKIASNAEENGGLAMLTYNHFKVKAPYYDKASKGKFDEKKAHYDPIHYCTKEQAEERAINRAKAMLDTVEVWKQSQVLYY